ncbi:hypothetical protein [Oscillatoria acuminata]|uniref:hypothetical protein n=1 Tax=Oscillatoria acuminata TaxID=118323 RepID=UPI00031A8586|nr:hypothetical protein [Oscillatoria acuminata]
MRLTELNVTLNHSVPCPGSCAMAGKCLGIDSADILHLLQQPAGLQQTSGV